MPLRDSPLMQVITFPVAAALCALVANLWAPSSRRLGWLERPVAVAGVPTTSSAPAESVVQPRDLPDRFRSDPSQPVRDIQPEDAWELFQAKAPFLDARRHSDYLEGHVAGAWSVPVWESNADARITEFEALAHPTSTTPLVLYCSGGDCQDSHLLASKLAALGYRNLLIYKEGFPDWLRRGQPSRKGAQP